MLDLVNEELEIANTHELMLIFTAFRSLNNPALQNRIMTELIKRSEKIRKSAEDGSDINLPVNLFYTYQHN